MGRAARGLLAGLLTLGALSTAQAEVVYRVQPGDTLFSLARRSGTSVAELQRLNGLDGTLLRVGQALRLPDAPDTGANPIGSPGPASDPASTHSSADAAATVGILSTEGSAPIFQSGMAVYYGGRADSRTVLTAAHLTLPLGTWVEVTHARSGRSVLVLINDRGPFGRPERVIDLSSAAARELGILSEGVAPVTLRIARQP